MGRKNVKLTRSGGVVINGTYHPPGQIPDRALDPAVVHDEQARANVRGNYADENKPPIIKFRCDGCRRPVKSVIMPWTPPVAKHRCRFCGHISHVQNAARPSVWDTIEGAIEEGEFNEKMKRRKSVHVRTATDPKFGRVALID